MWLLLIQVFMVCNTASVQGYRYVKPNYLSAMCPGQPCLTLDQYAEMAKKYFTSGSTFVFLSGDHSLHTALNLTNIADIHFRGIENSSNSSSILLGNNGSISCNNINYFTIEGLSFVLCRNQCIAKSALWFVDSGHIAINNSVFLGNWSQRSLLLRHSNISVVNCFFERNKGYFGGAITATSGSIMYISRSTFTGNIGKYYGGAIGAIASIIILEGTSFLHNAVELGSNGGALECNQSLLTMNGNNIFKNNSVTNQEYTHGGAISMVDGKLIFSSGNAIFTSNQAVRGGAIEIFDSEIFCTGPANITLTGNRGVSGGGMYITDSSIQTDSCNFTFINNYAALTGGGIFLHHTTGEISVSDLSANLVNNTAEFAGAIYIGHEGNTTLKLVNITGNSANAVVIEQSKVTFISNRFFDNFGNVGGGIFSKNSNLLFRGFNIFNGNTALKGGAVYALYGEVSFWGTAVFVNNSAEQDGGALYAVSTIVALWQTVNFTFNYAQNGGAVYFKGNAYMTVHSNTIFNSSHNTALGYGGGIYHVDNTSPFQCSFDEGIIYVEALHCIFHMNYIILKDHATSKPSISSYFDFAGTEGSFLYGGLLDRCQVRSNYGVMTMFQLLTSQKILKYVTNGTETAELTSKPYALCFCDHLDNPDCNGSRSEVVHRGQPFTVPLLAIAQGNSITSTSVTAVTSHTARLKIGQNPQHLPRYCSNLTFNLFSTKLSENLILYPEGPCHDSGFASVIFNLTILPCPDGFGMTPDGQCVCEERLRNYDVSCIIDKDVHLMKKAGSEFWLGADYINGSYNGLILYRTCPIGYCKTGGINVTLHNLDTQCTQGRMGLLCGGCANNYSLLIGSSECKECSSIYLLLILPFAAAGIGLVAFLSILRLTVATGMVNSLIVFANIVQVNKKLFFPASAFNIITVFIAWLNLDLGIETCFYNGMDAFAQTCLQFAFPVYVWVLISLIILSSRYSITVSKLIGHNPIAVLATLLLMSYTKILKIIIEAYSTVTLHYPRDRLVRVWLKDANVPYLKSKHLALTVAITLVLVFFFLPYTLLLLLGHKLYRKKRFGRFKPLLDSYYAPYKIKHRYWTGLMLLIRCGLYIVFSFNSLGGASRSHLAIIITFTAIGCIVSFVKMYKNLAVNILEASVYFNLVSLSAVVALSAHRIPAFVYFFTGCVFFSMAGVIVYHFHVLYIAKSTIWLKITTMVADRFQRYSTTQITPPTTDTGSSSHDPFRIVSRSVISLREPLLESESDDYGTITHH